MKSLFDKFLSVLLITFVVWGSFLNAACDEKTAVEKAAKASLRLSGITLDTIRAVRQAYEQKLITLEQKDQIALKLKVLVESGKAFNEVVKEYSRLYADGQVPPDKWQLLDAAFSEKTLNPFSGVLAAITGFKISPELKTALNLLRTTVQTIGAVFGKVSELGQRSSPAFNERLKPKRIVYLAREREFAWKL